MLNEYKESRRQSNQSLDKAPFNFSNIFRAMQSCAMNAKSRIIPKLPKSMVKWLEMG